MVIETLLLGAGVPLLEIDGEGPLGRLLRVSIENRRR